MEESSESIAKPLLEHVNNAWSTMVMRAQPFSDDLFQCIHPNHQVLLSCKPHRPGRHQWKPMQMDITADIKELQPDVIVECYLDAKYYHYDPADIYELTNFNVNVENIVEVNDTATVLNIQPEECSAAASLNDIQELEKACPEWEKETKAIHPKWLEHHQSGDLTKDPGCPVCLEEAGSKVNHRCRKRDRQYLVLCIVNLAQTSSH